MCFCRLSANEIFWGLKLFCVFKYLVEAELNFENSLREWIFDLCVHVSLGLKIIKE